MTEMDPLEEKPLSNPADRERIQKALRELGEPDAEIDALTPALLRLSEAAAPLDPAKTAALVERLAALLPAATTPAAKPPSRVRQALARRWATPGAQLLYFLDVARAQISILRPGFWLFSLFITLLGGALTVSDMHLPQVLALWLVAPTLAMVGVHYGFLSAVHQVGELEAVCPVSPLRLTLARLIILLSYDILLLGGLSAFFAGSPQSPGFGGLLLHWLAPLLLVTGVALAVSVRFSLRSALTTGYLGWILFVFLVNQPGGGVSAGAVEGALGFLGLSLLLVGVWVQSRAAFAQ
jgi:hypothetical protein